MTTLVATFKCFVANKNNGKKQKQARISHVGFRGYSLGWQIFQGRHRVFR